MRPKLWLPDVRYDKDPDEIRTYTVDFIREIQSGVISSISLESDPASSLTVDSSSFSGSEVTFTLSGGSDGDKTYVTITMTMNSGEVIPRSVDINISKQ